VRVLEVVPQTSVRLEPVEGLSLSSVEQENGRPSTSSARTELEGAEADLSDEASAKAEAGMAEMNEGGELYVPAGN
jgi:hypothetical protein